MQKDNYIISFDNYAARDAFRTRIEQAGTPVRIEYNEFVPTATIRDLDPSTLTDLERLTQHEAHFSKEEVYVPYSEYENCR